MFYRTISLAGICQKFNRKLSSKPEVFNIGYFTIMNIESREIGPKMNGKDKNPSSGAQEIIDNLVRARGNGAKVTQFTEEGYKIVYPEVREMLPNYVKGLIEKGVPKQDAERVAQGIRDRYEKTPDGRMQRQILLTVNGAVKALTNGNPAGNSR